MEVHCFDFRPLYCTMAKQCYKNGRIVAKTLGLREDGMELE